MKYCPISNFPVDLMTLSAGVYQVACPKSGWFTSMFTDLDDAIEFRATADILALLGAAKREERNGMVRLVGDGIMTKFMTPDAVEKILGSQPKAKSAKAK